jgi:restriction system protein
VVPTFEPLVLDLAREAAGRPLTLSRLPGIRFSNIFSGTSGHRLATLVDAVLQIEGYLTRVSPPGPDGGVDILAGTGPMGFGQPRLCVQVKSSPSPVDVNVLRGLQGVLQNFHAEQGLLVCWGGFKSSVIQEARQSFFTIRLWDSGDLLGMILKNHDKFPDELKAELPLKRIWALVLEE